MANSKFDDLLTQLGTGKWNFMFIIASGYWNMYLVPHILAMAFIAPQIDYSCIPPDHAFTITSTTYDADGHNHTTTDNCHYYANSTSNGGGFTKESCDDWFYDNTTFTSTHTSQFDLVCSAEYLRATFTSMYMFGTSVGAPINGLLSDRYGRRTTMIIGVLGFISVAIGSCWIPVFSGILAARFVLGFLHPPVLQSGYILALEVTEPKHRSTVGIIICLPWAIGTILWGGAAYILRDWQWLQLAVSIPAALMVPILCFLDESPRWLIVNGRFEQAHRVLRKAARWNHTSLPPTEDLTVLMRTIQKESAIAKEASREDHSEGLTCKQKTWNFFLKMFILCRTPKLRIITLALCLSFFLVSAIFYGLALNAVNYSADPFVYMVLGGLVEVPAYTVAAPIVGRLGRKWPIIICYLISGSLILALAFIPPSIQWLVMMLAMVGKMCISAAFQILYLYSMELFPTEVRLQGLGVATVTSRLGSMCSPFITDFLGTVYPWVPSLMFGLASLLAGLCMLPLKETLGIKVPDTIADLENPTDQLSYRSEEDEETELAKLRA